MSRVNTNPRLDAVREVVCVSIEAVSTLGRDIVGSFYLRSIGLGGSVSDGGVGGDLVYASEARAEGGSVALSTRS